jgi:hypothetical protein
MFLAKESEYSAKTFMLKPNNKHTIKMMRVMEESWLLFAVNYISKFGANHVDAKLEIH